MKSCCITGHRQLPDWPFGLMAAMVSQELEGLIDRGCTNFIVGGALGFDMLAESCVLGLMDGGHRPITLSIYVPFRGQEAGFPIPVQKRYRDILAAADRVITLSEHYYDGCFQARNRRMVDDADCCLAYLIKEASGTGMTVRYAERKGLPVTRIASPSMR